MGNTVWKDDDKSQNNEDANDGPNSSGSANEKSSSSILSSAGNKRSATSNDQDEPKNKTSKTDDDKDKDKSNNWAMLGTEVKTTIWATSGGVQQFNGHSISFSATGRIIWLSRDGNTIRLSNMPKELDILEREETETFLRVTTRDGIRLTIQMREGTRFKQVEGEQMENGDWKLTFPE